MTLRKLIKEFQFTEEERTRLTIGAKARLNPAHYLQLKEESDDTYPLTGDTVVKTWIANPSCVTRWLGFEVFATHQTYELVQVTSLQFRLGNGTNEYYWNGSAWAISTTLWNTEAQIAANIATFPTTAKRLQVIIKMITLNKNFTPLVHSVRVLYEGDIEFQEDIIYRTLIPAIRDSVRSSTRHTFLLASATSTIDLNNVYPLETAYNISSIVAVYNHTDDAQHVTNLYSSYNPGTKVITLTGSVDSGKQIWIDLLYEPEVSLMTAADYLEIAKVPAIILEDVNILDTKELSKFDSVLNRATNSGFKIPPPYCATFDIQLSFVTDKGVDHVRLSDSLKKFFRDNRVIRSVGLDEYYRLWLLSGYDFSSSPNKANLYSGRMRFRVVDVLFFLEDATAAYGVSRFHLGGDLNVTIE